MDDIDYNAIDELWNDILGDVPDPDCPICTCPHDDFDEAMDGTVMCRACGLTVEPTTNEEE